VIVFERLSTVKAIPWTPTDTYARAATNRYILMRYVYCLDTNRYMLPGHQQIHTAWTPTDTCCLDTNRYMLPGHQQIHTAWTPTDTCCLDTSRYMLPGHQQIHAAWTPTDTCCLDTNRYMLPGHQQIHAAWTPADTCCLDTNRYILPGHQQIHTHALHAPHACCACFPWRRCTARSRTCETHSLCLLTYQRNTLTLGRRLLTKACTAHVWPVRCSYDLHAPHIYIDR
jgi:hypothetical protein